MEAVEVGGVAVASGEHQGVWMVGEEEGREAAGAWERRETVVVVLEAEV
jgi:hypothetical protein